MCKNVSKQLHVEYITCIYIIYINERNFSLTNQLIFSNCASYSLNDNKGKTKIQGKRKKEKNIRGTPKTKQKFTQKSK